MLARLCRPFLTGLLVFALKPEAVGQIGGDGEYPQLRSVSVQPGGGFTVSAEGVPGARGPVAFSTPIAHGLRPGAVAFLAANTHYARGLKWFDQRLGETDSNGTVGLMRGFSLGSGWLTLSGMVYDSNGKHTGNLHYAFRDPLGRWRVGIGVSDFAGQTTTRVPKDATRPFSAFVVGTYPLTSRTFGTVGYGGTRFRGFFGSVSQELGSGVNAFLEQDTYGWNSGVTVRVAASEWSGRPWILVGTLASIQNRYPTWSVALLIP